MPRKIIFSNGVSRDVLYKGKIVNCYRCNTRHGLGDDCAEVIGNESGVPLPEQNNSSRDLTLPHPVEISATNEACTVVNDHRQAEVESNNDSPP